MYRVKTRYIFGKRDKQGRYLQGYYEYRDMFTKSQVQKVRQFIISLQKKQFTPLNVEKEFFDTGRYFLFDCYGNLLYVGTSNPSVLDPEGIKKELRKFYQADFAPKTRFSLPSGSAESYIGRTKLPEPSTHPSADPEIRNNICTYAVQYVKFTGRTYDSEDTKNPAFFIPCGLHNDLPRRESCNADMRELITDIPKSTDGIKIPRFIKSKNKIFKDSLPTIFANKKQIGKRPIIQCKRFVTGSDVISCRAVEFVKPKK